MKDGDRGELLKRSAAVATAGYIAPQALVINEAETKDKDKKKKKKRPPPSLLGVTNPNLGTSF
jgi:hypothetical protein